MTLNKTRAFFQACHNAFALLRWRLQRAQGSLLQDLDTAWPRMRSAAGGHVRLAVAHQEDTSEMKPHAAQ